MKSHKIKKKFQLNWSQKFIKYVYNNTNSSSVPVLSTGVQKSVPKFSYLVGIFYEIQKFSVTYLAFKNYFALFWFLKHLTDSDSKIFSSIFLNLKKFAWKHLSSELNQRTMVGSLNLSLPPSHSATVLVDCQVGVRAGRCARPLHRGGDGKGECMRGRLI